MSGFDDAARRSVLVLGLLVCCALAQPAVAASVSFTAGGDDDDNSWELDGNWSGGSVPASGDDVTVPDSIQGAHLYTDQTINSLLLDGGLNVHPGADLTVTNGIDNVGQNSAYFIVGGTVNGALTNGATGYVANSGDFVGDVTANAGEIINGHDYDDDGNVIATGTWTGKVLANANDITNDGGTWTGDVVANDGTIYNQAGATWMGKVLSNSGEIENLDSTWIGDVTNAGLFYARGTVEGAVDNSSTFGVLGQVSGITSLINTGSIGMDDGEAHGLLSAQSWSGTGGAIFDFAQATGSSDQVVLSGNYSGDTDISFNILDPGRGRVLGIIPVLIVGGSDTGVLTADGLPEDGVISYRLLKSGNDWVIASSLSPVMGDVAGAVQAVNASTEEVIRLSPEDIPSVCQQGTWARALGSEVSTASVPGAQTTLGFGGVQAGRDIACLAVPNSAAKLSLGITGGVVTGNIDEALTRGGTTAGGFTQGFGGVFASLVDGDFHAIIEGRLAAGMFRFRNDDANMTDGLLDSTRFGLDAAASYDLDLGPVTLTPQLGISAGDSRTGSSRFADVGTMSLSAGPDVSAYAGVTVASRVDLGSGGALAPFVTASLHDQMVAPTNATFTDAIGGTADLPLGTEGSFLAVGAGVNYAGIGDNALNAGLRADARLGDGLAALGLSAHALLAF